MRLTIAPDTRRDGELAQRLVEDLDEPDEAAGFRPLAEVRDLHRTG